MSQVMYIPKSSLQKLYNALLKQYNAGKLHQKEFVIEVMVRKPSVELYEVENPSTLELLKHVIWKNYAIVSRLSNEHQRVFQKLKALIERLNHSTCFRLSYSFNSNTWYFNVMIYEPYSLMKFLREKESVLTQNGIDIVTAFTILISQSETEDKKKLMKLLGLSKKKLKKLITRKYKKKKWIFCKVTGFGFNGKLKIAFIVKGKYLPFVLKVLKAYYYETGIDKSWLIRHDKLGLVITRIIPIN